MGGEKLPDGLVDRPLLGGVQMPGVLEDFQLRSRHPLRDHVRVFGRDNPIACAMDNERRRADPLETAIAVVQ